VDFAHPEDDLSGYRVVLAPASYLLTDAAAANISAYVRDGGRLVVGPFSGIVDREDGVREGGLNAALAPVLGLEVHEFCPLRQGEEARLVIHGKPLRSRVWCEDLHLTGAEAIGTYVDGPVPGGTAATRHDHGRGRAWYLASDLGVEDLSALFDEVYASARITKGDLPEDVELLERVGEDGTRHLIALNHTGEGVTASVDGIGALEIPAGGAATARTPAPVAGDLRPTRPAPTTGRTMLPAPRNPASRGSSGATAMSRRRLGGLAASGAVLGTGALLSAPSPGAEALERDQLANPGFAEGLSRWRLSGQSSSAQVRAAGGRPHVLHLEPAAGQEVAVSQRVVVGRGGERTLRALVRAGGDGRAASLELRSRNRTDRVHVPVTGAEGAWLELAVSAPAARGILDITLRV